ncbi:MAG: DUF1573 domain-containing protein [Phycisphaerales bacterium]|nr:DUF1573 domain-containing protein [Phycisphaerales bacterium]
MTTIKFFTAVALTTIVALTGSPAQAIQGTGTSPTAPVKPAPQTAPGTGDVRSAKSAPKRDIATQGKEVLTPSATKPANSVVGDAEPTTLGATPQSAVAQTPAPLTFDPPLLNLGEMQADVAKSGKIKIQNNGTEPIRILKAIPGCGCTTAGWPKDPIPAGEFAEIEITLKPGPKQGTHLSKRVTFQVEGYAPLLLTVEGDVAEYIHMVPDIIDAPSPEKPSEGRITLTSADGTPFKVTNANPAVLKELSTEAKTEQVVYVDWARWEELGRGIKLTLSTDHPKSQTLSVIVKRSIKTADGITPPAPARPTKAASPIVAASRIGDVSRVQQEIGGGANVNEADPASGRSALHWAAKENKVEVISLLIAAKADLNLGDRTGKSALAIAAESGSLEATRMLIEAGATVNHRDAIQGSPLLWAAGLGTPETVAVLIEAGADVNIVDVNGLTPLLWAAGIGNPETVKLLLARNPDLKIADQVTGDTALLRAVRSGKPQSVKLLIEAGADVNAVNRQGLTPLLIAAGTGTPEKLQLLLDARADMGAMNSQGMDAKELAKRRSDQNAEAVRTLLGVTVDSAPAPVSAPDATKPG